MTDIILCPCCGALPCDQTRDLAVMRQALAKILDSLALVEVVYEAMDDVPRIKRGDAMQLIAVSLSNLESARAALMAAIDAA